MPSPSFRFTAWAIVAVVALGLAPVDAAQSQPSAARQLVDSAATYAGQDAIAVRLIEATMPQPDDVARFQFGIRRFLTDADAATALDQSLEYAETDPRFAGLLQPAEGPDVADDARAVVGQLTLEGVDVVVAILFVLDGRYLHNWTAVSFSGDPLAVLGPLAEDWFAGAATPEADATPDSGAPPEHPATLLDRLPSVGDLPVNHQLDSESAQATDPPTAATPPA
jgi:hypothetical protein